MHDLPVTAAAVGDAAEAISGAIARTPTIAASALSELVGAELHLKLEILAVRPDLDTLVVPIGGGGLISGIAVAAKALKPEIEIVGVQSTLYPSMYRVLRGEDPGPPAAAATLAEGIAVKEPGRLTRQSVAALVSASRLVNGVM